MNINVQVNLAAGETVGKSAQEIAETFLADVGGDPAKDSCYVTITDTGSQTPPPPEPIEPVFAPPPIGPTGA